MNICSAVHSVIVDVFRPPDTSRLRQVVEELLDQVKREHTLAKYEPIKQEYIRTGEVEYRVKYVNTLTVYHPSFGNALEYDSK